jgi:hypothetical protein
VDDFMSCIVIHLPRRNNSFKPNVLRGSA